MKRLLFIAAILVLFAAEILRVYFIMPFPGSQRSDSINFAYFLHNYIFYIRIVCLLIILIVLFQLYPQWRRGQKIFFFSAMLLYAAIFYLVNFKFLADKMFYQPRHKNFATSSTNKIPGSDLVIGVALNGEAKAFPIEIIGYHHQVQDTIGGHPVMVTYCSVCRTGRVYEPFVNGKKESFRLVGMDHFNAMFEDKTTKSWWYQATGEAIAGPLKNKTLAEIPSQQMTLSGWLRQYPNSFILQPDPDFIKQYKDLKGFNTGTIDSKLEKRDSGSWNLKSWVVGIKYNNKEKAYDWNDLIREKVINDSLGGRPILLFVEPDSISFHAFSRIVDDQVLQFTLDSTGKYFSDVTSASTWNFDGKAIAGPLRDKKLKSIPAHQEFWHSWKTFHPGTSIYKTD